MAGVSIGKTLEEEFGERRGRPTESGADEEIPDSGPEFKPGEETRDHVAQNVGFGSSKEYERAKKVADKG